MRRVVVSTYAFDDDPSGWQSIYEEVDAWLAAHPLREDGKNTPEDRVRIIRTIEKLPNGEWESWSDWEDECVLSVQVKDRILCLETSVPCAAPEVQR